MRNIKENSVIFCLCLLISFLLVYFLASPLFWDFKAFHLYNGWAFWNWRYDIDTLPTLFRTYFNPIVDAFSYLLLERLNFSTILYCIVENLWYCGFIFVSFLIYKSVLGFKTVENKIFVFLCFILSIFSPILLMQLRFHNVMPQNLLALISIYLFIKAIFTKKEENKKTLLLYISAFLIGLVSGLKYTFVSFGIATLICILINKNMINNIFKTLSLSVLCMFAGFMVGGGWWMYYLWVNFHNPLYPYMNNLFNPADGDKSTIFAQDFIHLRPKNIIQFLFYPLINSRIINNTGYEQFWFDIKVPIGYISVILYFCLCKYKQTQDYIAEIISPQIFNTIVVYTSICYLINLLLFAQVRYLVPLIPFLTIIIFVICYVITRYINLTEATPNMLIAFFIIISCFYSNYFAEFKTFNCILYALLIAASIAIIHLYLSKNSSIKSRGFILSMLVLFMFFLQTSFFPFKTLNIFSLLNQKLLTIEDLKIEDDSAVLVSLTSTFWIPFQNPKAEYIGLTTPAALSSTDKNRKYQAEFFFQNKNLEEKVKRVFKEKQNVYLIYGSALLPFPVYNNYIKYYSEGKIMNIHPRNCRKIDYYLYGMHKDTEFFYFCKLK